MKIHKDKDKDKALFQINDIGEYNANKKASSSNSDYNNNFNFRKDKKEFLKNTEKHSEKRK